MWHANERVIAFPDSEESGWAGTVRHVDGQRNYVILDNGEDGWFLDAQLRPLKLIPGAPVLLAQPEGDELIQGILSTIDGEILGVRLPPGESLQATLRDLRFPRRTTKTGADERNWQIGDRVLARWGGDLFWYPGTVLQLQDDNFRVLFDDQDQAIVSARDLVPLTVHEGDRVLCRPKFEPALRYFPAVVTRVNGEIIDVTFDDIELEERNTNVGRIRVRRSLGGLVIWEEGDRALVSGRDGFWYPAILLAIDGDRIFVSFFDSRHAWALPEEVKSLRLKVSERVEVRKEGGKDYLPAQILELRGESLRVKYADDLEEWTLLRLLRLPAVPTELETADDHSPTESE
jgi:hypothetical protein